LKPSCVAVVDDGRDGLAEPLVAQLASRGHTVRRLASEELALVPILVDRTEVLLGGGRLAGAFFHAAPRGQFATDFVDSDAGFVNHEVRAAWLAALCHPTVAAINRPDAERWFGGSERAIWHRRMRDGGVPVTPLRLGHRVERESWRWLPWGGGVARAPDVQAGRTMAAALTREAPFRSVLWCAGVPLPAEKLDDITRSAGSFLDRHAVSLAQLYIDPDGLVVSCTTDVQVEDRFVDEVANRLGEALSRDLHRR
jgi:hypothetical protein